jgi:hypothetical protein
MLAARNNGYLFLVNKEAGQYAEEQIVNKARKFYESNS